MPDSKNPSSHPTRYVVLWHGRIAEPHFDLMFETLSGSELATWRSPAWPIVQPTSLTRLKDHRRVYLDYEGDLTHNRGHVKRIESGECMLDVGENARWTIEFFNGHSIVLKLIAGDEWQASPDMRARSPAPSPGLGPVDLSNVANPVKNLRS